MGISVDCWISAAQPRRLLWTILLQIYDPTPAMMQTRKSLSQRAAPFPTSNIVDLISEYFACCLAHDCLKSTMMSNSAQLIAEYYSIRSFAYKRNNVRTGQDNYTYHAFSHLCTCFGNEPEERLLAIYQSTSKPQPSSSSWAQW